MNRIDISFRAWAVLMLTSIILGMSTACGKVFLWLSAALVGFMLAQFIYLLTHKKLLETILIYKSDPIFFPGFILLCTAVTYTKGMNITFQLVLLGIVIVSQLVLFFLNKRSQKK